MSRVPVQFKPVEKRVDVRIGQAAILAILSSRHRYLIDTEFLCQIPLGDATAIALDR